MNIKSSYSLELWKDIYTNPDDPFLQDSEYNLLEDSSNTSLISEKLYDIQYWDEKRLCVLSDDKMDFPGKAYDIKFTQKLTGEDTLDFSINRYYKDNNGDKITNPLASGLLNESKIKLHYRDKWYDFIVKTIQETHENYNTMTCTCQSLAVSELSKIGYNIKFSQDSAYSNSTQSAHEFMEQALEESDWEYIKAGTKNTIVSDLEEADLREYSTEAVSLYNLGNSTIEYYSTIETDEDNPKKVGEVTGGYIYFPSSELNASATSVYQDYIYVYWSQDKIESVEDNLIVKEDLVLIKLSDASKAATLGITKYYMEIPYRSLLTGYVSYTDSTQSGNSINQYCYVVEPSPRSEDDTAKYYRRIISQIKDIGYQKIIEPIPAYQWSCDTKPNSKLIPETLTEDDKTSIFYYGLCRDPYESDSIQYIKFYTDSYSSGDIFLFYKEGDSYSVLQNKKRLSRVSIVNTAAGSITAIISASKKTYYTRTETNDGAIIYTPYTNLSSFDIKPLNGGNDETVTIKDWYENIIGQGEISSNVIYKRYQYIKVDDDEVTIIGYGPTSEDAYYEKSSEVTEDTIYHYNINTQTYEQGSESDSGVYDGNTYLRHEIAPRYDDDMYRTIEIEKSNCLNITQAIAETFEVWCRYIIEHDENTGKILIDNDGRKKKWVTLVSAAGADNPVGFTYGLNSNSIQRTIQSSSIITKLYVDYIENDSTETGVVSIAYADQNIGGEQFLLNFDYYVQMGRLDGDIVSKDLYNFYDKNIAESKLYDEDYFGYLGDQSVDDNGIPKGNPGYLVFLGKLNEDYNYIYNIVLGTGEASLSNQLAQLKAKYDLYNIQVSSYPDNSTDNIIATTRSNLEAERDSCYQSILDIKAKIEEYQAQLDKITAKKKALNQKFNKKYIQFIQEGNWSDSSYVDDDRYYFDARKVSIDSAKPSVEYSLSVVDLSLMSGYDMFQFNVGDQTWIEDPDMFGYDGTKPHHESVIVKEISVSLDNPSESTITIANNSNNFQDIFEKLSAAATSYSLNESGYNRSTKILTSSGAIDTTYLQESFNKNKQLSLVSNNQVVNDSNGITVKNIDDPNQLVRVVGGGIVLSDDGGETYTTGIYAGEINTELIKSGQINTGNLTIGNTTSSDKMEITGQTITISRTNENSSINSIVISPDGFILGDGAEKGLKYANGELTIFGMTSENISNGTVSNVTTSNGFTFNGAGLTINNNDESAGEENNVANLLNSIGMTVYDKTKLSNSSDLSDDSNKDAILLSATSQGVTSSDITVRNYLIIGENSRLEDYGEQVTKKSSSSYGKRYRTACYFLGD